MFYTPSKASIRNKKVREISIFYDFETRQDDKFQDSNNLNIHVPNLYGSQNVGDNVLTYDQLETYVVEIEAILNSRPLSLMFSDPNDLLPLTAGHFLIGGPMTSLPDVDFIDTSTNRLSAWQHAQKPKQHFWTRWNKEYLNNLIQHPHLSKQDNLQIGRLVTLREENIPPLSWPMGRITAVCPGPDGVIRVVYVKTNFGVFKRCVKKLCPLPLE